MTHNPQQLIELAFGGDSKPRRIEAGTWHDVSASGTPNDHFLFATSGSSGNPAWIAHSRNGLLVSAKSVNRHLEVDKNSVWGLALPVHHVGGFGVLARAYEKKCSLRIFDLAWDASAFVAWLDVAGITHTSLVPTQVYDLVESGMRAPHGLRSIVVGGGRLDLELAQRGRDLGWPLLASYGLTEAGSQVATQSPASLAGDDESGLMRVLPHWDVRLNADGCLELRGEALFSGVVRDGVYIARVGDWYATSDRVTLDSGGLVPLGRADHWVKVAGELVDPSEVEERLLRVAGAGFTGRIAVVADQNARLGCQLRLIAEEDVPGEVLERAISAYNGKVPRSQRLGQAMRVAEIPRGELGKIRRGELHELLESR